MGDANSDVEHLNSALVKMAELAASDPSYREALKTNQVEALQNAGVSAFTLSGVFAELGAEEDEVAAFGMAASRAGMTSGGGGGEPAGIIINGTCIGTCVKQTITITIGCRNSFV